VPDAATIDQLLAHIGLAERPAADAAGLRQTHRAFVGHLAYDGLTAQLGEHTPLDADRLIARTLATGRGGYCFEINTILLTLLEAIGFTVERREAVVGGRDEHAGGAATNHMALVAATAGGERFLCDAGWGEGPLEPVALRTGTYGQGPLRWTLERDGDDGWWIAQHPWGGTSGFRFADAAVGLSAFAPHHERLATSKDSNFVKTLVVQQPHEAHVTTLRARTLSHVGPARDERAVLADAAALAATLRATFGIDPDALGAERIARLWAGACAQHEAYIMRGASPSPSTSAR
jgi:N-hydroxyarylamine O-acetyltransferase